MWTVPVGRPVYNLLISDISGQKTDFRLILAFSIPMGGHAVDNFPQIPLELHVACGEL